MKDNFPEKDAEFIKIARRFADAVIAAPDNFAFSPDELNELDDAVTELENAYQNYRSLKVSVTAAREKKDSTRKKVEQIVRPKARRIYTAPGITDSQIVGVGLRPHDDKLTRINAPDSAPQFSIDNSFPLMHKIRFWEEGSIRRRRKPKGVIGVEIWRKMADEEDFRIIGMAMSSPHAISYKPEDTGKQAHYYLIWVTRRGEKSPPAITQNATITG